MAAAVSIQAAWRSFLHRQRLHLTSAVLNRRAAICIQRAWRSVLFQRHCRALSAVQLLLQTSQVLTYVPSLCLTLRGARMIALAQGRRCNALPGQKLRWAFLEGSGGMYLTVASRGARLHALSSCKGATAKLCQGNRKACATKDPEEVRKWRPTLHAGCRLQVHTIGTAMVSKMTRLRYAVQAWCSLHQTVRSVLACLRGFTVQSQ
jgi:hypothetical protein